MWQNVNYLEESENIFLSVDSCDKAIINGEIQLLARVVLLMLDQNIKIK